MRDENVDKVFLTDDGIQKLYRFANGFGASVIRTKYSYGGEQGLWELAVTHYDGDTHSLCYDTEITDDVIGNLTEADVDTLLQRIENLEGADVVHASKKQSQREDQEKENQMSVTRKMPVVFDICPDCGQSNEPIFTRDTVYDGYGDIKMQLVEAQCPVCKWSTSKNYTVSECAEEWNNYECKPPSKDF